MFAPTKTWRKWHRKVAVNLRRYAIVSAVAASAVPSLVFARGHKVQEVEDIPLVVPSEVESYTQTKQAVALLKKIGAFEDVDRVKESVAVRAGQGKMRNRRYVHRRGPLVVYANDQGVVKAFRNLPGVDLVSINKLSILQLAPGGHLGRFVIWTKAAFSQLDNIFGTSTKLSKSKSGYKLPRPLIQNADLSRLINSEQIQSVIRPNKKNIVLSQKKRNPLKSVHALRDINPYAVHLKKIARKEADDRVAKKQELVVERRRRLVAQAKANKASKKAFYKSYLAHVVEEKPVAKQVVAEEKEAPKKAAPAKKAEAKKAEPEDEDSLF